MAPFSLPINVDITYEMPLTRSTFVCARAPIHRPSGRQTVAGAATAIETAREPLHPILWLHRWKKDGLMLHFTYFITSSLSRLRCITKLQKTRRTQNLKGRAFCFICPMAHATIGWTVIKFAFITTVKTSTSINAKIVKDEKGKMSLPIMVVQCTDGASRSDMNHGCTGMYNSARTFTQPSNMAPGNEAVHPGI